MKKKFYFIGLAVVVAMSATAVVSCTKSGKGCTCDTYGYTTDWTAEMMTVVGASTCAELQKYLNKETASGASITKCK